MNPFHARHLPLGASRTPGSAPPRFLGVPRPLRTFDAPRPSRQPPSRRRQLGVPKAALTPEEAYELLETLDVVLLPITRQERALEEHECLREFEAGPYPLVVRLRERLAAFLARAGEGGPGASFEISQGELVHVEKAVACAESIGRGKTLKIAMAGGGAAVLALLLIL